MGKIALVALLLTCCALCLCQDGADNPKTKAIMYEGSLFRDNDNDQATEGLDDDENNDDADDDTMGAENSDLEHTPEFHNVPKVDLDFNQFLKSIQNIVKEFIATISSNSLPKQQLVMLSNNFVDRVLAELRVVMEATMEPLPLPDIEDNFDYKIIFITYNADFTMNHGLVYNVSHVSRSGPVRIRTFGQGSKLHVKVPLNLRTLPFTFDYRAKLMGIGPEGRINGRVQNFRANLRFTLDPQNNALTTAKFEIVNKGTITFSFDGNPMFDWALNFLKDIVGIVVDRMVTYMFSNFIQSEMESFVADVNLLLNELKTTV